VISAYKYVTPGNPCATRQCHPHSYCRVSNITNNAICEPFCGSDNGGCRRDQICRIQEFECDGQCDPHRILYCENSPLGKLIYHTVERSFQNGGQMSAALSFVMAKLKYKCIYLIILYAAYLYAVFISAEVQYSSVEKAYA